MTNARQLLAEILPLLQRSKCNCEKFDALCERCRIGALCVRVERELSDSLCGCGEAATLPGGYCRECYAERPWEVPPAQRRGLQSHDCSYFHRNGLNCPKCGSTPDTSAGSTTNEAEAIT